MVAKRIKTTMTPDEKMGFRLVVLSAGIDLLGVSVILPVLPFIAKEFNATDFWVGVIFATYALAQTISVPIGGRLSDKYGRRPLLLMSLMGSAIGFFLQGFANSLTFFLIARFVAGIFGATPPIAKAYIGDVVPAKQKKSYYGIFGAVVGVAFLIGPALGSVLARISLSFPMFVGSGLSFSGFLLAYFKFKEPEKHSGEISELKIIEDDETKVSGIKSKDISDHHGETVKEALDLQTIEANLSDSSIDDAEIAAGKKSVKDKEICDEPSIKVKVSMSMPPTPRPKLLPYIYIAQFLNMAAFTGYLTLFALVAKEKFNWDQTEVGLVFSYSSIVFITVQMVFFPKLADKIGKHGTGIIGGVLSGLSFIAMPLIPGFEQAADGTYITNWVYIIAMMIPITVMAVGFGFCTGTLPSIVSRYATPEMQGTAMGTAEMGDTIARIIMPIILAYLFQEFGSIALFGCALCGILESVVIYGVLSANRRGYGLQLFVPTPKAHLPLQTSAELTSLKSAQSFESGVVSRGEEHV